MGGHGPGRQIEAIGVLVAFLQLGQVETGEGLGQR